MVQYYLENDGIITEVRKEEQDMHATCGHKYNYVLGGKLFKAGTQVRKSVVYHITSLDSSWSTLVNEFSNMELSKNLIIHLDTPKPSNSLDYKYASSAPFFTTPGGVFLLNIGHQ